MDLINGFGRVFPGFQFGSTNQVGPGLGVAITRGRRQRPNVAPSSGRGALAKQGETP